MSGLVNAEFMQQISIKAAVFHDSRLLTVRKQDAFGGQWELPGGRLGEDEHPLPALARELQEELGYTGTEQAEILTAGPAYPLPPFAPMFYIIYAVRYPGQEPALSDEHVAWEWMTREQVRQLGATGAFNPALAEQLAGVWDHAQAALDRVRPQA